MRVVFLAPHFPAEMPHFVRALAEAGAEVIGVSDAPPSQIPPEVQRHLAGYVRLDCSIADEDAARAELVPVLRSLAPDRIEALWEPIVLLAAGLRDELGLGGMSRDTVLGFRDKQLMKERLAAAGVRVPRSTRATPAELTAAADAIGFPLVIKPIAGAGTADTHLVRDAAELARVMACVGHVRALIVEEFILGEELTYDTVSIDGVPVFDSVAQYFPKPLESRTQEWISPGQIVFRDPHAQPELAAGVALGRQVLKALGMQTGFTHMEWFRTPSGEAVFGEIAARAPGAKLVDQMNWANDFDVFRGWAQAVMQGRFDEVAHRRFHVACVFKRALGRGRITRVAGAERLRQRLGPHIVEDALLRVGAQRRDWKETLLSDGWIAVRHLDLETCRAMMQAIVQDLTIYAE